MRLAIAILFAALGLNAQAAMPKIQNNWATTNSAATVSNIVASIASDVGGGGDTVWMNTPGFLMEPNGIGGNTNGIVIRPNGRVGSGTDRVSVSAGAILGVAVKDDASISGQTGGGFQAQLYDYSGAGVEVFSSLQSSVAGNGNGKLEIETSGDGYETFHSFLLAVTGSSIQMKASNVDGDLFTFVPTIADGTTPYTFDTSVAHTSGNLLDLKNHGATVFAVTTTAVILPRMSKTERNAIGSPVAGLAVYQTDATPGLRVFNGANWMRYTETAD